MLSSCSSFLEWFYNRCTFQLHVFPITVSKMYTQKQGFPGFSTMSTRIVSQNHTKENNLILAKQTNKQTNILLVCLSHSIGNKVTMMYVHFWGWTLFTPKIPLFGAAHCRHHVCTYILPCTFILICYKTRSWELQRTFYRATFGIKILTLATLTLTALSPVSLPLKMFIKQARGSVIPAPMRLY